MKADEYVVERLLKVEQDYEMAKSRCKNLANENTELNEIMSIFKKGIKVDDFSISFYFSTFDKKNPELQALINYFDLVLPAKENNNDGIGNSEEM